MAEYIDKDKLLDELRESAEHHAENSREEQLMLRDRNIVRAQPAADVAPVIHAKWIERGSFIECSNCKCGQYYYADTTYCPHCGAKMDKEDKE